MAYKAAKKTEIEVEIDTLDKVKLVRLDTLSTNDFFFHDGKEYKVETIGETATVVLLRRVMVDAGYPELIEHIHGIARETMELDTQVEKEQS